jgi:type IV pilus biogenesis protein CpaD/CtpE
MKFKHSLIIVAIVLMFLGCASDNEQVKKNQPITAKTNDEIPISPELKENSESVVAAKIKELKQQLIINGV